MLHVLRCLALVTLLLNLAPALATEPASGSVTTSAPMTTFTGGPYTQPTAAAGCDPDLSPCDDFMLTVTLPAGTTGVTVQVDLTWDPQEADLDLEVLAEDGVTPVASDGAGPGEPERVTFPGEAGTKNYIVRVNPFAPAGATATGTITLNLPSGGGGGGGGTVVITPPPATAPRYQIYTPPAPLGENAGEPSLGVNFASKRVMYVSGLQTLRATFAENLVEAQPESCEALWEDKSYILTSTASLDPILHTDAFTGRTWVSQLRSVPAGPALVGANSYFAFTDDDGDSWTPGQLDPPEGSYDHQTVGAGPYPALLAGLGTPLNNGSAVYYCAQAVIGLCSRSDDGGLTFGRATAAYNLAADGCGGIHGHVRVGPDGTVYLPHRDCGSNQALAVSEDAGVTWVVKPVDTSTVRSQLANDPSYAVPLRGDGANGYFCYNGADGQPHVVTTHDRGDTWVDDTDIGAQWGIKESVFVEAIAGDPDRAACGFVGTATDGNPEALDFPGVWHLYIAHSYDAGKTWTTIKASDDPVQHAGGIWLSGGGSVNRNLLDFNEIVLDERGRVLYGYADGCTGSCVPNGPNNFTEKANFARQSGGKPLYAEFDTDFPQPAAPLRACLAGRRDDLGAYLTWREPDSGGAAISGYKVFRATSAAGPFEQIGSTGGKAAFNDRSARADVEHYFYKVIAQNSQGESAFSNPADLLLGPRPATDGPCTLPGVIAVSAPTGDATYPSDAYDITSVSAAEPGNMDGKLVFTLKVVSLETVPNGWRWAVRFQSTSPPPNDPNTGAAQDDYFAAMITSDGAAPSFVYGTSGLPNENAPGRFFNTLGDLEEGSGYNADGSITLIVDKTKIGNPQPGGVITSIFGSVRLTPPSGVPGTGGTNETIADSTGAGAYTLRAADLCLPNTPPLAIVSASVSSGGTPLNVSFDGSASRDAEDGIASYAFNFGDGSEEVSSPTPGASHRYTQAGVYVAKLIVTDARGLQSVNPATVVISAGAGAPDGGRFGASALSALLLLPMLLCGFTRRRRT